MVKWEHLTVVMEFNYQTGKIKNTAINGVLKEYAPDREPSIKEYLAHLSEEGWDLVGIVGTNTYLFSRRR